MSKLLTLSVVLFSCLKVFSQCASQTVVPDSAFNGKVLLSSGSCITHHLNVPLVSGIEYTMTLDLTGNIGTCGANPSDASVECQIFLGYDSCDMTGQVLTASNSGFPFPDTLTRHVFTVHPTQAFTYISVVYSFNAGQGFAGCPSALNIDSFKLSSSATPLAIAMQLNNNSCAADSNGKAIAHATGYSPFAYLWSNGQTDSVLQHASAGTYELTVADITGCLAYDTVRVGSQTPPTAAISLLPNNTLQSATASSYQWYFNGSPISGGTNQDYVAQQDGNYDVVVIDSTGCTSNASNTIYIGDVTGIGEIGSTDIKLYPNPATSTLVIYSDNAPMTLKLCNIAGREIISKELSGNLNNLDISQMAKGMYVMMIQQDGKQFCEKLIIQ